MNSAHAILVVTGGEGVMENLLQKRQYILLKSMEKNFEDKLHDVYQPKPLYH